MQFQTKALYNLLRFNYSEDPSIKCEKWQIEDLRERSLEELFKRLHGLKIGLDKNNFLLYAEKCNDPEELAECLLADKDLSADYDKIYLIIFELWRRLCPEKLSISVFCDELDYRIHSYLNEKLKTDELIQDSLAVFLDICNKNADVCIEKNVKLFDMFSNYLAHDLESFLYEYIEDQIDFGNVSYATDLIEGFYRFFKNVLWFDFLRAKIASETEENIMNDILQKIINENTDVNLSLEMINFMVQEGSPELFINLAKKTLENISSEKDFLELMESAVDFYTRLDNEEKSGQIKNIIRQRSSKDGNLDKNDKDLKSFSLLLN